MGKGANYEMRKRDYILKSMQFIAGCVALTIVLHDIKRSFQLGHPGQFLRFYNTTGQLISSDTGQCLTTKTKPKFDICPHDSSEDIYISQSLSIDGLWERTMTNLLAEILANEQNITFIDIGANIGYFSLLAAAHGNDVAVVAVEPIVKNLKQFHKAIVANKFDGRIKLLQNVVSDIRRDRVNLAVAINNQGAARVLSDNELRDKDAIVETGTSILMDDLIGQVHTPHVIIKLDVEGHECKAMAKSSQLFKTFKVKTVFMEWQKMSQRKYIYGTSCTCQEITRLSDQLSMRGFTPYDVQRGKKLDVTNSAKWTSGDVIWKRDLMND